MNSESTSANRPRKSDLNYVRSGRSCLTSVSSVIFVFTIVASLAGDQIEPKQETLLSSVVSWPSDSQLKRQPNSFQLLAFIHPDCKCNRSTLAELKEITNSFQGPLTINIVVWRQADDDLHQTHRELQKAVAQIDRSILFFDRIGSESERFGARISGHCVLFDQAGQRIFSGGLGSGHESASNAALSEMLRGETVERAEWPVSGCSLRSSSYDFFTNYGNYMPRIHCLHASDGRPDWPWISAIITLNVAVLLGYVRIFWFWRNCYLGEGERDRDNKLMQLAWVFLLCGAGGYALSTIMFFWPAYRLLAISLFGLAIVTWRFASDLEPFRTSFGSYRLQRQLNETLKAEKHALKEHNVELADAHRALREVTEQAELLALVARYTDNAVVITDSKAKIEWVNDGFTRITGYTLEDVRGRVPGGILQGERTDPEVVRHMRQCIAEKKGFDVEIVNYSKDGREYWLAIEVRPIRDAQGEVTRFIAIESDITERKHNERERERLNSKLQAVAHRAGMAEVATDVLHNVGNVLNSVNVSAGLIRGQIERNSVKQLEKATSVISQHEHELAAFLTSDARGRSFPDFLKRLSEQFVKERNSALEELKQLTSNIEHIKDIVSVQQSFAGKLGHRESVAPRELVEDALKMHDTSLERHHIRIERCFSDVPNILAPKHTVLHILINLVKNAKQALDATNNTSKLLKIATVLEDGYVCFKVSDNGAGITAENLERIFQHGFTTKQEGHGFGLHSGANAAQELGGSLTAHSPGPGKGATFVLRLPTDTTQTDQMTTLQSKKDGASTPDESSPMISQA